jgi:phosphatidylserine/phosphatidylglycerophosphate/cardiolipin synthase-like enzyme
MKKILTTLISLSILGACSTLDSTEFDLSQSEGIKTFSEGSKTLDPNGINLPITYPLTVIFNNSYKMLFEENQAIGQADPKNSDKYFVSLVNSAKTTLDAAFYDIDDPFVTQAIINASKRGVKVRIVTDTDNMTDEHDPTLPRKQIADMRAAGIEVKDDKRSGIMHQKFMIIDSAVVLSGSMNLTTTSIYQHNNNIVIMKSPEMATTFTEEFNRLFEENKFGPNKRTISFPQSKVGDATVKVLFSPKGGANAEVMAELQKAQKSIKFMNFSLTGPELQNVIVSKKNAGLLVEGVLDECLSRGKYSLLKPFKEAKIYVLRDGNQALLHHKVFIIDDETVITGSSNYSASAENSNNENTLIIKSKNIASFYSREYSRIKYAAQTHKDIPDYDNPACGSGSK